MLRTGMLRTGMLRTGMLRTGMLRTGMLRTGMPNGRLDRMEGAVRWMTPVGVTGWVVCAALSCAGRSPESGARPAGNADTASPAKPPDAGVVRQNRVRQIAMFGQNACVLFREGTVSCWGDNRHGQLGNGTTDARYGAHQVQGLSNAVSIAVGADFACAVRGDGTLVCWGSNSSGQLGSSARKNHPLPTPVPGVQGAVQVAAAVDHACITLRDSNVMCWGDNSHEKVGRGPEQEKRPPAKVVGVSGARQVSVSSTHSCALTGNGVTCWGSYSGIGKRPDESALRVLTRQVPFTALSSSWRHSCGLQRSGHVLCWGNAGSGRLGGAAPPTSSPASPMPVAGLSDAVSIAAGDEHTCAVKQSGAVTCWGEWRPFSTLEPVSRQRITKVDGLGAATLIAAGEHTSCAALATGQVACWGNINPFQFRVNSQANPLRIRPVVGLANAVDITAGHHHVCAALASGQVMCWGMNYYFQVAPGSKDPRYEPVMVKGVKDAVRVSAGKSWSYAFRKNGGYYFWGGNEPDHEGEVETSRTKDVTQVAAGHGFRCVLRRNGEVRCEGENSHGQLGDGSSLMRQGLSKTPVLRDAVEITADIISACARRKNGQVVCWGKWGDKVLARPVKVKAVKKAARLVGSGCVITAAKRIACWGNDPQAATLSDPVGEPVVDVAGTNQRSCWVLANDASVWCSERGNQPVRVRAAEPAMKLALGTDHSCALRRNGSVVCWGDARSRALGTGRPPQTPLLVEGL